MSCTSPEAREEIFARLHAAAWQPWYKRWPARLFCHTMVRTINALLPMLARVSRRPSGGVPTHRLRILLTGTFFADNWVEAHARPLAAAGNCEQVWVVADRRFVPMDKVTYLCPPAWLQRLIGRVPARLLTYVISAVRLRPDVVGGFHLLFNGLVTLLIARLLGARAMYFCVGGWAEFAKGGVHGGNRIFNMISRDDEPLERALLRAVRQFDLILTMGTRARDYLLAAGVPCPVHVMPGGIDQRLYVRSGRPPTYDLVTISRIESVKRPDVFLDAVRRIRAVVPDVRAAMVGDGYLLEDTRRMAAEMGLAEHVHFPGRRSDVQRWLDDSKVFVLTSDSEGLSLALMEAMMTGLPAVVSNVGDLGDLVEDGSNGRLPAPGGPLAFAEAITPLLTDAGRYRRYAQRAHAAALVHDMPRVSRRWETILSDWTAAPSDRHRPVRVPAGLHSLLSRRSLWILSQSVPLPATARRLLSRVKPHAWLGRPFRKHHDRVLGMDRRSADELADYQLKRVQGLLALAYERSPFYRRIYRECGFSPGDLRSLDDLAGLPTVSAADVREHVWSMSTCQHPNGNLDTVSTGGTTGRPLRFLINMRRSAFEYAHLIAAWSRAGYQVDMPLAVLRGRVLPLADNGLHYQYDPLLRHHYYSVFHLNDETIARYLEHIRTIGPCFLHVYPSSVAALAGFIRRRGVTRPANVRGIIAESENIYPSQRAMIEEAFGVRMFACYGHTEKVVAAAECESSRHYHVFPTYGYCELLDEAGRLVTKAGQVGEITGTGFVNTMVPFIRYRTGDYARLVGRRCDACGRSHLMLDEIRGHRIQERLIAADGGEVSITAINMHDDTFEHVRRYQFLQEVPGTAVLRIEPDDRFGRSDLQKLTARLERKLSGRVDVRLALVDSIPPLPNGKFVYIDQRITATSPAPASASLLEATS